MKTLFIIIVSVLLISACCKEKNEVYSFSVKNNWDYLANNMIIKTNKEVFVERYDLMPDSVTKTFSTENTIVYVTYNIDEGLLKDTFKLSGINQILVIENKHH